MLKRIGIVFVLVLATSRMAVASCSGASPNDMTPDDDALNACLAAGGTVTLDPGSPGYIVATGLVISQDYTVLTSSGAPWQRATVIAGPNLFAKMLVTDGFVTGFEISFNTFEGRVDDSGGRNYLGYCSGSNRPGNLDLAGYNFSVHDSETKHALCGSGMGVNGSGFSIYNNYVAYNGRDQFSSGSDERWSDGMTVFHCDDGEIYDNTFVDNTDIDLVVGSGACSVHDNTIWHGGKYAWAGLNPGNFDDNPDHSDSSFSYNSIENDVEDRLGMGLLVGSHPWNSGIDSQYASVTNNTISGAVINLIIEGEYYIAALSGSSASGHQGSALYGSCTTSANYTAYHYSGTIQSGASALQFDSGTCTSR